MAVLHDVTSIDDPRCAAHRIVSDRSSPMTGTFDVLGIGENSVDIVCRVAVSPRAADATAKQPMMSRLVSPGGQVATTLCTCAAMGLRARYVGAFGDDGHARLVREAMDARGVDTGAAVTRPAPNRHAVIVVADDTGERVILWERDPRLAIAPAEVDLGLVRAARWLHIDAVDEALALAAAGAARTAGLPVSLDVDEVTAGTRTLLERVSTPILSEHALAALTGEADHARGLRALRTWHSGLLCVTCGASGAMALEGDRLHVHAGYPVQAVDTTAAGDVFRGAFIAARLRGEPVEQVLRIANAAAALACTRAGAILAVPSRADIEALAATG